jgi:ubiquinone biosynthesis protein UbiJ
MRRAAVIATAWILMAALPAGAQDIRGLENCTAEKQMDRRTGCLQANTVFLQQALAKLTRETQQYLTAASRETAAARAEAAALRSEIVALKDALAKLTAQVDELQNAKPAGK